MVLLIACTAGCNGSRAAPAPPVAHRIEVAASVFPLAEIARRVGLDRVTVTDLSPGGADAAEAITRARLVLLVGRGFQPAMERAAAAPRAGVVDLWDALGGDEPHFWLDPVVMQWATDLVAAALARADPAGRGAYQAAARSFDAQLGALDIDYRSSLAGCQRRDLVSAGAAFARPAARYGLISHTAGDPGIVELIRTRGVRTVFTEPPLPPGPAETVARAAGVNTVPLETLTTRTPAEEARGAGYLTLMTDNLAKLRAALACSESSP